ncbi:hypothetical protein E8E13_004096 [Curvularia kusanoi]|uniref:Uncharacterized protein n=1 Tax=Curvularia kusanoi TaxID=90978 RepID=A0A9P4TFI9_CURKU|nr:hypothetical protein E8E13_004096 [Curvularia kusanoi]
MASFTDMPLSSKAKAVTLWLLGAAGLPTSLTTYGAFFAGVAAETLFSPGLFRFIQHHSYDPSRIQLAVFHVIRLFEQRYNYNALLRTPNELMAEMEKEVLFMVDKHISATEATHVLTDIKRRYGVVDIEERPKPPKRARQACCHGHTRQACPRGFVAEDELPPRSEETLTAVVVAGITSIVLPQKDINAPKEEEFGCVQMPGGFWHPLTPPRRTKAPSPKPGVPPCQTPSRVPRHAPEKGSFGLDYDSKELYESGDSDSSRPSSPTSSDFDSDPDANPNFKAPSSPPPGPSTHPIAHRRSGHPTVVRKLHGLMRAGTSLSPIAGSPDDTEAAMPPKDQPSPLAKVASLSSRPPPPNTRLMKKGRGRQRAEVVFVEPPKAAKEEKEKPPKAPHNPKWMRRRGFTITR